MNKAKLIMDLAAIPDGDARLNDVATALAGKNAGPPDAPDRLLKTGEVCRMLSISRATAWRWERDGVFTARQIRPGCKRYSLREIERLALGGAV